MDCLIDLDGFKRRSHATPQSRNVKEINSLNSNSKYDDMDKLTQTKSFALNVASLRRCVRKTPLSHVGRVSLRCARQSECRATMKLLPDLPRHMLRP